MKKLKKIIIKLKTKNSNYMYTKKKSKRMVKEKKKKLNLKKYDPFTRTHTIFQEVKIK